MQKRFKELTEREILALAIQNEEEDGRIYGEFADALRESYPATADMFEEMRGRPETRASDGDGGGAFLPAGGRAGDARRDERTT